MNNLPKWTTKNMKQHTKYYLIMRCQCGCGRRFEIIKSLAKGRKYFNKEHEARRYEVAGMKGKIWSEVKVKFKGGKK